MATHPLAIRNGFVDFVLNQVDTGTTNPTPRAVFRTTGDAEVATLNMASDAFGASVGGIGTAGAIQDGTNSTGGTTTKCTIENRDNGQVFEATVATSGAEINLTTNVIPPNATVRLTALTYQGPA